MPRYEFLCEECGPFEQWINMSSITEKVDCPTCDHQANRMYSPPGIILTSYALRRRVEQSAVPKVVKREHGKTHDHGPGHSHQHTVNRPWMAGH
jgi:putative FmdB family regulatory protein